MSRAVNGWFVGGEKDTKDEQGLGSGNMRQGHEGKVLFG
jgi:hypothetical protein